MGWAPPVEAQRRLAFLCIVAVLATAWSVALGTQGLPPVPDGPAASASPAPAPVCPFPHALRTAFLTAAHKTNLAPGLLYAVAKVESNLRQDVQSSAGAQGLLQVMPATARALALDPTAPDTNILAGASYLRQMLDEFGTMDLALAAYNAGPTAVARVGGAPSADVLTYVANVTAIWRNHAGCS
jgi:soluble lytic murein transglycosylase-like protein